ncbi:uncharacterized protein UDID_19095 [Ustilago sp. UG-2017a]|nr:uncharacterized protein UDID_19095 [Ustilago sp. UG-2017a]
MVTPMHPTCVATDVWFRPIDSYLPSADPVGSVRFRRVSNHCYVSLNLSRSVCCDSGAPGQYLKLCVVNRPLITVWMNCSDTAPRSRTFLSLSSYFSTALPRLTTCQPAYNVVSFEAVLVIGFGFVRVASISAASDSNNGL